MKPIVQIKNFEITRHRNVFNCSLGMMNLSSQNIPAIMDTFNEEEVLYIKNLKEKRMQSFITGRYLTKVLIGNCINETDLKKIVVKAGVFGQPLLQHSHKFFELLDVSLSHSKSLSIALVYPNHHLMGIDVEEVKSQNTSNISTQLSKNEIKLFDNTEEEKNFHTRIWTIKEALSKVIKTGLTVPLQILEVQHIVYFQNHTIATFTNFSQYKAISIDIKGSIISIVLPKQSYFCPNNLINFLYNQDLRK